MGARCHCAADAHSCAAGTGACRRVAQAKSHMDIECERIIELCLKYGDPEVTEMLQEDAIEDALVQGVPP